MSWLSRFLYGPPRPMPSAGSVLTKGGRGQIPRGILSGLTVRNGLVEPLVSPVDLWKVYLNSWMIQAAVDKKVSEAVKEVGPIDDLFKPKFEKRCDICDINYQEEPEGGVCEECHSTVRDPDSSQLRRVKQVLEQPTTDDNGFVVKTWKDLVREAMTYEETIGDAYWEVLPSFDGQPAQFWPLASEFIRKVDEGKEIRFCPYCFTKDQRERIRYDGGGIRYKRLPPGLYANDDRRTHCQIHPDIELKIARWVQVDDLNNISALWDDEEILQFGTRQFGTRPYSVPKMICVWYIAQTLRWQERYLASSYALDRMPQGALTFPGMSQEQVTHTFEEVAEWKRANPSIPKYLILGAQEAPTWTDFTMSFVDLEAKEMALFHREAIAIVWGVSLQMLGIQTPGKLGKETEVAEVSYAAVDELQSQFDEFVNTKVIARFTTKPLEGGPSEPVVTDWIFELPSAKRDDLLRKAQLVGANVDIIQKLQTLGVKARPNKDMTEVTADWSTYDPATAQAMQMEQQRQEMETRFGAAQEEGKPSDLADRLRTMKPGEVIDIDSGEKKSYADSVRGGEIDFRTRVQSPLSSALMPDAKPTSVPMREPELGRPIEAPDVSRLLEPQDIAGEPVDADPTMEQPLDATSPPPTETPSGICDRCKEPITWYGELGGWKHDEPASHDALPTISTNPE